MSVNPAQFFEPTVRLAFLPVPSSTVRSATCSAVTEAITKLWKNGQFSSTSVIVGIAGLRAITREIDLPYVPDNEVDSAVRFQSEEVIPFPPDQTILSSQILADYTSADGDKMRRVLVAAAHVDLVNGVIEAVEKAGLTVVGVDLISSALVRAIGGQDASEQPEAIVSVGAGLTVVVVHQQGRPQFVRTIGSGGNATTAAVSAALDLPLADAEGVKRRIGEPIAQMQAAERAAQASMNELVGEIRNSIQYFASLPGRLPVSRVLITGGGSELGGLSSMLEDQVRLPVLTVSPLARLDTSKLDLSEEQAHEVGPVLATPIGLALPEPDKAVKKFNLLPPEVAQRARMKKIQQRTSSSAAAVLVALGPLRSVEVLPGAQRPERRQRSSGQHRHLECPDAEVRPRGCGQQCLLGRRCPTRLGPQFSSRLARGSQPPDCHHPGQRGGPVVQRPVHWAGINATASAGATTAVGHGGSVSRTEPDDIGGDRNHPARGHRPGSEPFHLRSLDQRHCRIESLRQSPPGGDGGQSGHDHLVPLRILRNSQCQPREECEPEMNAAREYRLPLLIGAGALVVALILYAVLVAPQSSKLSTLHAQETQLQASKRLLRSSWPHSKPEKQNLTKSCAELKKIATQIPSVQSPTDVDAEESSFESQFNGLAETSGVTLTQFSGFTPASTASATPATTRPEVTGRGCGRPHHPCRDRQLQPDHVVHQRAGQLPPAVRDPDLQSDLRGAVTASSSSTQRSGTSSDSQRRPATGRTPLWVGGTATSPSAGPYSLAIVGSIYYTSAPNALSACTKATTSIH